MRPNRNQIIVVILLICAFLCIYFLIYPIVTTIYANVVIDLTRIANTNNYALHTKPLTKSIVEDVCAKLKVDKTSEDCKNGVTVYAPELFDEIEIYFNRLPKQSKNYDEVNHILGSYLVNCEQPGPEGNYRCRYDLKGDAVYPLFFYFDKDGFYYRIITNTSGS